MQAVTKTVGTLATHCEAVVERGHGLFENQVTRDRVATQLSNEGFGVQRSSVRRQNLHPEYVVDYVGTYHTGFGNSDYQTYWSVLYEVRLVR